MIVKIFVSMMPMAETKELKKNKKIRFQYVKFNF